MESRRTQGAQGRAEETLRLLAGAANAVRLYPESSPLREAAIARFTQASSALAAQGPLQFAVDRKRFIIDGTPVGHAYPQVAALAEALHALQVGQLIIAPGITPHEVKSFLAILGMEARNVRSSGGMRDALVKASVSNLAVVEVSLRASTEDGIMGLDLTTAPAEEIASELPGLAHQWLATSREGAGRDDMATAIDTLESAARDLAAKRVTEALLRLDEAMRTNVITAAMQADPSGKRMDGMLRVIAKMNPSALARLLRLVASRTGQDTDSLLGLVELPPEVAAELQALLTPAPQTDEQRGVPADPRIEEMASDMSDAQEQDSARIEQLVSEVKQTSPAGRALETTVDIARMRPSEESIKALGEALPPAVQARAFPAAEAALALLQELSADAVLGPAVTQARTTIADPGLLADVCTSLIEGPAEQGAVTVVVAAGPVGAEALLGSYVDATEAGRNALRPAAVRLTESIGPVASRIVRTGDLEAATSVLSLLGSLNDKRVVPTMAQALEHLDAGVRCTAVTSIAEVPGAESTRILSGALAHTDVETRRMAAKEIGRLNVRDAVPALIEVLDDAGLAGRNHELKKEVLRSLDVMRPAEAIPALSRIAQRRFVIGKQNREIRYLARRVLAGIREDQSIT